MQAVADNIRFIGVEDDNLVLFEGQYPLPLGISYNSYIIDDNRIAVVDAVDSRRCVDWMARLESALDGREPFCLIVQHVEPDHTGSILAALKRYPAMKIVATAKAVGMLCHFFEGTDFASHAITVADGDTLSLGATELSFVTAPMVHWPEVMVTLDTTHGVLFSADAFGSFAMSSSTEAWDSEARRYYCNIVGKYGPSVRSLMKKLLGRPFGVIAPLHGPVLTGNLARYWNLYHKWSGYEPETEGTLVAYASIYGGTAQAARRLAAILAERGCGEVVTLDLCRHDVSYAVAEAFRLSRMALCSVTYDAALFPAMHDFIHHLALKNLRGRRVALVENGSWAPVAGRLMADMLGAMKDFTVVAPPVTIVSRPDAGTEAALQSLADALCRS